MAQRREPDGPKLHAEYCVTEAHAIRRWRKVNGDKASSTEMREDCKADAQYIRARINVNTYEDRAFGREFILPLFRN